MSHADCSSRQTRDRRPRAPWITLGGTIWMVAASACTSPTRSDAATAASSTATAPSEQDRVERIKREEERVERIKAEARAAHPGDDIAGTKAANEALVREADALGKGSLTPKQIAAGGFIGYYAKCAFGLQAVCHEHGVELDSYSARFVKSHARLLRTVDRIVDTTLFMDRAKASGIKSARQQLERFAAAQGTDVAGICRLYEADGGKQADDDRFANVLPDYYATLTQGD